jgi:hypothetical protein
VLLALALALAARAAADPFADRVADLQVGAGGGGGDPTRALGPPDGGGAFSGSHDTISLGLGGTITLEFTDNAIVDGPGPDFTVFENAFLLAGEVTYPPFAEPATVSVSDDGVHFVAFTCALDDPPYYPGCAGVYPVFATASDPSSALVPSTTPIADLVGVPFATFVPPGGSGGDSFDLAGTGLAQARFVRIIASGQRFGLDGLAGFDLDAVAAVHSLDLVGDTDGDGIPDASDPCPSDATCRPLQRGRFTGGGRSDRERALTYAAPTRRRVEVALDETHVIFAVAVAPTVEPSSVRLTLNGRDASAAFGTFTAGTTKMVSLPLDGMRTVVRLRAATTRGGMDVDHFVIRKRSPRP